MAKSPYFKSVNGEFTTHFLMYNQPAKALIYDISAVTKAYFENGLFPYRGKFHPQLTKALINIIGFAIDYVKNDESQLKFLGYDVTNLRRKMIGLIGKNKNERLKNYFKDMESDCSEVSRVLKKDKYFVMIIGSNTNQTGGIRLERTMIESCKKHNLTRVKSILKPIKGMRNTKKTDTYCFLRRGTANEKY